MVMWRSDWWQDERLYEEISCPNLCVASDNIALFDMFYINMVVFIINENLSQDLSQDVLQKLLFRLYSTSR